MRKLFRTYIIYIPCTVRIIDPAVSSSLKIFMHLPINSTENSCLCSCIYVIIQIVLQLNSDSKFGFTNVSILFYPLFNNFTRTLYIQ